MLPGGEWVSAMHGSSDGRDLYVLSVGGTEEPFVTKLDGLSPKRKGKLKQSAPSHIRRLKL